MERAVAYLKADELESLLLLGLGGGSAISIIRKTGHPMAHVTAVELDTEILSLAGQHFGMHPGAGLRLVHADARVFLQEAPDAAYSAIIDDLFIDTSKPEFTRNPAYIENLHRVLQASGLLVINFMAKDTAAASDFIRHYTERFTLERQMVIFGQNYLYFLRKHIN